MATTYTITRPNAASYDFTINLDAAFAVAMTIRWEIHPTQGEFPLALTTPWTGTVAFDTSQTNQLVTAAITRNHKFLRDFEIRLYDVADNANTPLFTSDAQSIAGDSTLPDRSRSLSGGSDQNVIGLGLSDHISSASGGAGDDTFLITRFQYGTVEIRDGSTSEGGKNLVKFDYEVTITGYHEISSDFFGDMAIDSAALTLSTGAVVTIQSPVGSFRYQLGNGAVRTYDEFKSDVGASGTADTFAGTDTNRFTGDYTITAFTDAPTLSGTRREAGVERSLSGASNEDIFTATSDYDLILSGGAGDDVFVISRFQYGTVEIRDGSTSESGKNLVKFDYEVTITGYHEISSDFFGDMAIDSAALTLSTGAVVTIQSPVGSFRYQLGNGAVRTYDEFKSDVGASGTADTFAGTDTNRFNGDYTVPEPTTSKSFKVTGILSVSHPEDVGEGDALATFKAVLVRDENVDVSYSITEGNIGGVFKVVKDGDGNAVISLAENKSLDFEILPDSYKLNVVASSMFAGEVVTHDIEVTIAVRNVNEYSPVFAAGTAAAVDNVPENVGSDYVIKTVRATDADRGDGVTYSIADADRALFKVHEDNGDITLKAGASLDYEHLSERQVSVIATDSGGKSSQERFTIRLMDVNDHDPTLTASVATGSVRTDTVAAAAGTDTGIRLILDDDDAVATNGYTSSSFTISGTESGKFEVRREVEGSDAEWGLYFIGETGIDFSRISGREFDLSITVTDTLADGTRPISTTSVKIEELTSSVTFLAGMGSRTVNVMEGVEKEVGVKLATVEATSIASGKITYAFEGGSLNSGSFSIHEDTGVITYAADTTFDFEDENQNTYMLNIVATDASNDNTATAIITVNVLDVNDHAPLFARATSSVTISESQAANVGFVTVTATDADGTSPNNDVVRYRITGGTGMGIFAISDDGAVSLSRADFLDYDTGTTSYTLEISAFDGGATPMRTPADNVHTLIISLRDANDIVPTYTTSGASNALIRTTGIFGHNFDVKTGYSITIDDADTNNRFTFGLNDERFKFVNQGAGVWDLVLKGDRIVNPTPSSVVLTYYVDDGKNRALESGLVNIEVVETSVRFTADKGDQSFEVTDGEIKMAGIELTVVEATAIASGSITYAFEGGSLISGSFTIDANSGVITYNADTNFDFEMQPQYTLDIVATNGGNGINGTHAGDTATATITINVIDVNEHTPTFPATPPVATVAEAHTAADGVFTTITATDADGSAPNNAVRYEIIAGNINNVFTIDENGGISVAGGKILDFGLVYTLTIAARDGGTPALTATQDITISVTESTSDVAEYSLSQNGRQLTAVLDTADPDGGIKTGTTPRYQWFDQNTGAVLEITNTNTYTLPSGAAANGYYGVIITYTDNSDVKASVIAYNFDKSVHVTPIDKTPTPQTTLTANAENLYIGDNAGNDATAAGTRNDVFYGLGGDDTFNGGGWNDVFYGGNQVDVFWGGPHSDVFVLDVDAAVTKNRHVDIVGDFTHRQTDSGQHAYDRIRVYVDDPAAITTLAQLQTALGVSFAPSSAKIWRRAGDDPAIDDLHIRNDQGIILMVLEDFYHELNALTLDMFEVLSKAEKPTAAVHHLEVSGHKGGANPLAQSILEMQSLKGANPSIQGTHSDLFEVRGNGLGTFRLFIKEGVELDHETHGAIALTIYFSEVKDVSGTRIESFDAQRVEITVTEGNAEYAITENQAGRLEVAVVAGKEDPDGVRPGTTSYRWFRIESDGTTETNVGTGAFYTPRSADAALVHGVEVTYRDIYDTAQAPTKVRVIHSLVDFADDEINVRINENDANAAIATLEATSSESGATISYSITGGNADGRFTIDGTSGTITLTRALNYENDATEYDLEITATSSSGAKNTAMVSVYVNDLNDFAPAFALAAKLEDGLSRAIIGTVSGDMLDGTVGVIDYINGGAGNDDIDGGGGDDHILAGAGTDTITLASAKDSYETIYYRFSSTDAGFEADDGAVTINNFRYYEDNLVLIDMDASVITLDRFLHDDNLGADDADGNLIPDGKLYLEVLQRITGTHPETTIYLAGIRIWIDDTAALTINFAEDSQPEVRGEISADRYRWTTAGEPFFGTLDNAAVGLYRGLYSPQLNDNTLLHAYVADLRIIDDADLPSGFATDVFISEARTNADGVFATIPATDDDATSRNNTLRYEIASGNVGGVFTINPQTGGISVAAGAVLDYETTTKYTLTIAVTDSGAPTMRDTHSITIGINDANDIAPMLAAIGGVVEASFDENNSEANPELLTPLTFSIADIDKNNDFSFAVTATQIGDVAPSAAAVALAEKFEVAEVNGVWTLKLKLGRTIDYETEAAGLDENDAIALTIVANDGENDSNEVKVVLTINNVNDTGPTLAFSPLNDDQIDEQPDPAAESIFAGVTLILGSVVPGLVPDLLPRHFSVQGDAANRFVVVPGRTSAEWHLHLKAGEILEYDSEETITLRVTADDGANAPYQTGEFTISVRDINNYAPVLAFSTPANVEISEQHDSSDPSFATIAATDNDGRHPHNALNYAIVSGDVKNVFTIDAQGNISVASGKTLDYETQSRYSLTIQVSDGGSPANTVTHNLVVTLTDVNDIVPTYTPSGSASIKVATSGYSTDTPTGYSITIDDADSNNDMSVTPSDHRFTFKNQGSGVWALFLNANQAITASPSTIALTYTVSDGMNDGEMGSVSVAVVETTVDFVDGAGSQVVDIDENTDSPPNMPTLQATIEGGGTILYKILSGNDDGLFAISTGGAITLTRALNYEDDGAQFTLTVAATNAADTDDKATAIITINVNDLNDHAPILTPPERTAGVGLAIMGTDGVDNLVGTGADEYISGGAGADTIVGGRGDDHIWGGAGDDDITLAGARGSVETIYYRIAGTSSGLSALDGAVTVNNFRHDEDNLFFVDGNRNLQGVADLLSDFRLGRQIADDGKLYLEPIIARTDGSVISHIAGIEIYISGTKALTINFAEDSQVLLRGAHRFSRDAEPFLGILDGLFQYRGFISPHLIDNTLLDNYINELRIIDRIPSEFLADIFISAGRTAADGVFTRVPATDGDGSAPNNAVRYEIISGNIGGVFAIDDAGGLRVAVGKSLDFTATQIYTLTVRATDGGTPSRFDTHTFSIALADVNDVVPIFTPSVALGGRMTLTGTDFDGNAVDVSTGYRITITDADLNNDFTFGLNDDRFEFRDQGAGVWELFLKEFRTVFYFDEKLVKVTYYVDDGVNRAADMGEINFVVVDSPLRFESAPVDWRFSDGVIFENVSAVSALELGDLQASGGLYGKPLVFSLISVNGEAYNAAIHSYYLVGNTLWRQSGALDYETAPVRVDTAGHPYRGDALVFGVRDETAVIESQPIFVRLGNVDEGSAVYGLASSTPMAGGTLTVNRITDDPDGMVAGSETYAWTRTYSDGRGVVSIGSDSPTYQRVADDTGTVIGVVVSYIDASSEQRTAHHQLNFYDDFGTILNPVISGTDGPNIIYGKELRTTINAKGGKDVVYGEAHAETINGGGGHDIIHGGGGADTINGDDGHDVIYGGAGNDNINGGNGNDIIDAGGGSNNRVHGNGGTNYFVVDARDYFNHGGNYVHISGYNYNNDDRIVFNIRPREGGYGHNLFTVDNDGIGSWIYGLSGSWDADDLTISWMGQAIVYIENAAVTGLSHKVRIIMGVDMKLGSGTNDVLIGGDGSDNFYGFWGDDIIYGQGGDETIYGGEGADWIHGGWGDDTLIGDSYETSVSPPRYSGNDIIYGGPGNDFIRGTLGSDHVFGGSGNDYLEAGIVNVRSVIYGGDGIDYMRGDTNQYWTTYFLDTRELADNTDIIAQFSYNPGSNEQNKLRVHVTAEQKAILDRITDDATWLATLQSMLNIRWDDSNRDKPGTELKALIANNSIPKQSREPTRHPNDFWTADTDTNTRDNVAFYHTRGTANVNDDYLILTIGKFSTNSSGRVGRDTFNVLVADPDFDPNGDFKAEFSLTANADNTKLFVATTRPDPDGIRGSFQYQWYSITNNGATDTLIGIDDTISESLDISTHKLPEGMAYGVSITYTDRSGKTTTTKLTTPAINIGVIGTDATETIKGGLAHDDIDGRGGNDHIWGGHDGNDTITLSNVAGDTETIYYRMTSGDGAIQATDGHDTINKFRPDEDRLILIDTNTIPLSLDDLLGAEALKVKPITEYLPDHIIRSGFGQGLTKNVTNLTGVEIYLDGVKALTINFFEKILLRLDSTWRPHARDYVGFAPNHAGPSGDPLDINKFIKDNALLKNYFGSGEHNNLRIISELPDRFEETSVQLIAKSQAVTITENTTKTNLATIQATGTGDITYRIIGGNNNNHFTIDEDTGIISLTKGLDHETTPTHELAIAAIDSGHGDTTNHHDVANVIVNVGNVNDNAPEFVFDGAGEYNNTDVSEDAEAGFMVRQVKATDADGDKLTFRITNFQTQNFEIDKDSGIITVKEAHNLDYDNQSTRQRITVEVTDGTHKTTTSVLITLINANDEPPEFEGTVSGFDTATLEPGSGATGGTSTGYKISISDSDNQGFSKHEIHFQGGESRFEFRPESSGILGRHDFALYLKQGESVTAGTINLQYRIYDGINYSETQSVAVAVSAAAPPAQFPAPPNDPNDYNDPLAGMTPLPDTDPFAG